MLLLGNAELLHNLIEYLWLDHKNVFDGVQTIHLQVTYKSVYNL